MEGGTGRDGKGWKGRTGMEGRGKEGMGRKENNIALGTQYR